MTAPFSPAPLYFGVASSTLITTNRGVMTIGSLANGKWIVWNGVGWEQVTIASAGESQPTYTVTLSDGRTLRCSANYNWYVQTPDFVTYQDRWTSQLIVGSSVIWRTLLPTDANYTMGVFPKITSVVATGTSEDLFYATSSTGLLLLNGILTSCGAGPDGLPSMTVGGPPPEAEFIVAHTPTPTPTPPSLPWTPSSAGESPIPDSIFFNYTFDPTVPTLVSFTSYNNDPNAVIVSYRWEFGDGQVAVTQNTSYQYRYSPNPYYVRLTVKYQNGSYGAASGTIRFPVSAAPPPPPPSPTPTPSPSPGGYVEPVAPGRSHGVPGDPYWQGALLNGVLVPITDIATVDNDDYSEDPYFTFEVPAGATNVTVNFTDNSTGDFAGGDGWLIVRPGSAASSNDGDLNTDVDGSEGSDGTAANAINITGPNDQNVFAAGIPDFLTMAGEYFVSLDVANQAPLSGMSIIAAWTDPSNPPPFNDVIDGDNGNLFDMSSLSSGGDAYHPSVDFQFTIPAATDEQLLIGDGVFSTWSVDVPPRYVLNVTLDDNANGDLATDLTENEDVALFITTDVPMSNTYNSPQVQDPSGPFTAGTYYDSRPGISGSGGGGGMSGGGGSGSTDFPSEQYNIAAAISVSNVPMYLQYINTGNTTVTVWVAVDNYGGTAFPNVRMLANLTPTSVTALQQVTLISGPPSPTPSPSPSPPSWYDVTTILGSIAGLNLTTEVDDWNNADTIYYPLGNPPPEYIADASYIWNGVQAAAFGIGQAIPSSESGQNQAVTGEAFGILARMASPEVQLVVDNPTLCSGSSGDNNGDSKVVSAVWGYQPFQYSVNQDFGGLLDAIANTGQLSILQFPIIIYMREVVILNFTPSDVSVPEIVGASPESMVGGGPYLDYTTSKSFVEMAVLYDTTGGANEWLGVTLYDSDFNEVISTSSAARPINPWVDPEGNPVGNSQGTSLAVYRIDFGDLSQVDVSNQWSAFVGADNVPNVANIQAFTQLFTADTVTADTPYYIIPYGVD